MYLSVVWHWVASAFLSFTGDRNCCWVHIFVSWDMPWFSLCWLPKLDILLLMVIAPYGSAFCCALSAFSDTDCKESFPWACTDYPSRCRPLAATLICLRSIGFSIASDAFSWAIFYLDFYFWARVIAIGCSCSATASFIGELAPLYLVWLLVYLIILSQFYLILAFGF